MASTAKDTIASANETTLELITGIQNRIVEAHKEFAAAVAGLVPDVPSWVPTADLPETPDPKDLVEQSFAFQQQLLEANKAFSLGLIEAWSQTAPSQSGTKATKAKASTTTK
jgi:hypothetical protein